MSESDDPHPRSRMVVALSILVIVAAIALLVVGFVLAP